MKSFLFYLSIFVSTSQAFLVLQSSVRVPGASPTAIFSDKQQEIAKLEEQLEALKNEQEAEAIAGDDSVPTEEEVDMDMFLTEQWKEAKANVDKKKAEDQSSAIGGVAKVVAALLALVLFSQVPIGGEDLTKYSVGTQVDTIDLGDLNRARQGGDL